MAERSDKARDLLHATYMQGYRDGQAATLAGRRHTPGRRAAVTLLDRLLTDGPRPAAWCLSIAQEEGVTQRTLYTAKAEYGVKSVKQRGRWVWVHPKYVASTSQRCKVETQLALLPPDPITRYTDESAAA